MLKFKTERFNFIIYRKGWWPFRKNWIQIQDTQAKEGDKKIFDREFKRPSVISDVLEECGVNPVDRVAIQIQTITEQLAYCSRE